MKWPKRRGGADGSAESLLLGRIDLSGTGPATASSHGIAISGIGVINQVSVAPEPRQPVSWPYQIGRIPPPASAFNTATPWRSYGDRPERADRPALPNCGPARHKRQPRHPNCPRPQSRRRPAPPNRPPPRRNRRSRAMSSPVAAGSARRRWPRASPTRCRRGAGSISWCGRAAPPGTASCPCTPARPWTSAARTARRRKLPRRRSSATCRPANGAG